MFIAPVNSSYFAYRLMCWIFHQMRFSPLPPPAPEEVSAQVTQGQAPNDGPAARAEDADSSFFHRTTVVPLYNLLKASAKKDIDAPTGLASVLCFCRKLGRKHLVKNSVRANYDDFNEMFWSPKCLAINYHTLDQEAGIQTIPRIPKTFREKSSYLAILLSFWRWVPTIPSILNA